MNRYLDLDQAKEYLGGKVSTYTIRRHVPISKMGSRVLVDVFDLDAYLQSTKTGGNQNGCLQERKHMVDQLQNRQEPVRTGEQPIEEQRGRREAAGNSDRRLRKGQAG